MPMKPEKILSLLTKHLGKPVPRRGDHPDEGYKWEVGSGAIRYFDQTPTVGDAWRLTAVDVYRNERTGQEDYVMGLRPGEITEASLAKFVNEARILLVE